MRSIDEKKRAFVKKLLLALPGIPAYSLLQNRSAVETGQARLVNFLPQRIPFVESLLQSCFEQSCQTQNISEVFGAAPTFSEVFESLSNNKIQIALVTPSTFSPLSYDYEVYSSLPGFDSVSLRQGVLHKEFALLNQKHNLIGFSAGQMGVSGFWSSEEINEIGDVKHLKTRAYSFAREFINDYGGNAFFTPYSDQAKFGEGLNSSEGLSLFFDVKNGLDSASRHLYISRWPKQNQAIYFFANLDYWNSLSDSQKKHLKDRFTSFEIAFSQSILKRDRYELFRLMANEKVKVSRFSSALEAKLVENHIKTYLKHVSSSKIKMQIEALIAQNIGRSSRLIIV